MSFDPISYDKAEKARKHSENVQEQLEVIEGKFDYKFEPVNELPTNPVWHEKGYMWGANGTIVSSQYAAYTRALETLLPVIPGYTYEFSRIQGNWFLYDNTKKNGKQYSNTTMVPYQITIPNGYYYLGVNIDTSSMGLVDLTYFNRLTPTNIEIKASKFTMPNLLVDYKPLEEQLEVIEGKFDYKFEPVNELPTNPVWHEKGYMWGASGTIVSSQYAAYTKALETLLPVIPGYTYEFSRMQGNLFLYDSNKKNGKQYSNTSMTPYQITVPDGYNYIGLNIDTSSMYLGALIYFNRLTPTEYELKASKFTMPNLLVDYKPLASKVIVNFGDSIFGNARPPLDISTKLAGLTGATVHNCGFGGCKMGRHSQSIYDAFSMYRLAYSIANNDWSLQDTAITDNNLPSYFVETLTLLKSIDFSSVDIVTIAYGTNDFADGLQPYSTSCSESCYSELYYSGALRTSIEALLTAFPNLRIFIIAPHYRFWMNASNEFVEDSNTKTVTSWVGGGDHTLIDFVQSAKDIGKEYQIPVIDNYFELGINKFNRTIYFPPNDGVHHNQNGRDLIAGHIAKRLW